MSAAIGAWILPGLAILFSIFTYQRSRAAKARGEESSSKRADIEAYEQARITYENQVASLRAEVQAVRAQLEAVTSRLSILEQEVASKARLLAVSTIYIRQLLSVLLAHSITDYPPIPKDLEGSI